MTRELKLALIVGFSLVLVVMVLVSDHLSKARKIELAPPTNETALAPKIGGVGVPQADVLAPSNGAALGNSGSMMAVNNASPPPVGGSLSDPLTIEQGNTTLTTIDQQKVSLERAAKRLGMETQAGNQNGLIVPILSQQSPGFEPSAPITSSEGVRPMGSDGTTHRFANGSGATLGALTPPGDAPITDKPVAAANEKVHVVESGESLYGISKQYYGNSKYWKQLLDYNKSLLKSESAMKVGMKLKVPDLATLTGKPADVMAPINAKADPLKTVKDPVAAKIDAAKTGKSKTYTVQKGDTPGTIAKKALGSSKRAHELMDLNKINDDGGLKIGMVLQLPE